MNELIHIDEPRLLFAGIPCNRKDNTVFSNSEQRAIEKDFLTDTLLYHKDVKY